MTELEQTRADLYRAETSLKTKELEMFALRYIVVPVVLALGGSMIALTVAIVYKLMGS
jgi:hypothetical protein